jgi:hypothetical protein
MPEEPIPNPEPDLNPEQIVIDPLLQHLSYAANVGGPAFGITLIIKGAVVTGDLIGRDQYFEEMNERTRSAGEGQDEKTVEFYNHWADSFFPILPEEERVSPQDLEASSIRYIHLSDSYMVVGPRSIPAVGPGSPFRVALSAVDGFIFGKVTQVKNA